MKEITKNEWRLREEIVKLSEADDFQIAKQEWYLKRIYRGLGECLCGHSPILNICIIRNRINGNETIVGSSCVQKFIGLNSEKLFASYRLIEKDLQSWLDIAFIEYLMEQGIINDWEAGFLKSTAHKRFEWLSEKQQAKRLQINQKVIDHVTQIPCKSE